jgi:hypothetical protein
LSNPYLGAKANIIIYITILNIMPNSLKRIQESVDSLDRICKLFKVDDIIPLGQIVVQIYNDDSHHHGRREATNQLKAYYNEACRYAIGQDIIPSTPRWVKRTRDKFPKVLNPWRTYLSSKSLIKKRLSLSYLRVYESILMEPVPDFSTVTSESKGAMGFESIRSDFIRFLNKSRFTRLIKKLYAEELTRTRLQEPGLHYSSKQGISGPAIGNCGKQSLAIDDETLDILKEIDSEFRDEFIEDIIKCNQEFYKDNEDIFKGQTDLVESRLGRVAFIPDKGAKTRLMAIGNYWIQDVLKGLHETLYSVLRRLKQDGTYDQGDAATAVRKATAVMPVWSYDLTAATDRFPIQPQQSVLDVLSNKFSRWSKLLTSIKFEYKGSDIVYSVGQPMGFYSSWATFALCHHFIVQYCAWKEKKKYPFLKYRILGDDVAIWDREVAARYKEILSLLDVTISSSKSIVDDNQIKPGFTAEFSKRIFHNGKEITPLTPNILIQAKRSVYNFPQLLEYLDTHRVCAEDIPCSRIKEVYQLHDKAFLNLCRGAHIWSLTRRPVVTGLTIVIPEFVEQINISQIMKVRWDKLTSEAEDKLYAIYSLQDENRAALEQDLGVTIPDNLAFNLILNTKFNQIKRFVDSINSTASYSESGQFEPVEILNKRGNPLGIMDIEFLPILTYEDIKSGLTDRIPYKLRRGKYIADMVARLDKITQDDYDPFGGNEEDDFDLW